MSTITAPSVPSARLAGYATLLGGVASAVMGAMQAVRPDDTDLHIVGAERVILALFAVAAVLFMPGYLAVGRLTGSRAGTVAGWLAAAGCALLAFGSTASNLNGRDFWWFSVVAVPANLAWLAGSVLLAVMVYRTRAVLPRWLAVLLPVVWVTSIILSQAGGNLVAGVIMALVGWFLVQSARS
jgi:hypothetical protein